MRHGYPLAVAVSRRLATLVALAFVLALGVIGTVAPQPTTATDDPICAIDRAECATVVITISGSASGKGVDGGGNLDCHRDAGVTTGTCTARFGIGLVSRTIDLYAIPIPQDLMRACIGAVCQNNQGAMINLTMVKGLRYTVAMSLNPINPATVTVTKLGDGTGTVTSGPPGLSCGSTCSYGFVPGTAVTLTAALTNGSLFGSWAEDGPCSGQDLTCSFTANISVSVEVTFVMPLPPPPTQPPPSSPPTPSPTVKVTTAPSTKPTATPRASIAPTAGPGQTSSPATAEPSVEPAGPTLEPEATADQPPATDVPVASTAPSAAGPAGPGASTPPIEPADATDRGPFVILTIVFALLLGSFTAFIVYRRAKAA